LSISTNDVTYEMTLSGHVSDELTVTNENIHMSIKHTKNK